MGNQLQRRIRRQDPLTTFRETPLHNQSRCQPRISGIICMQNTSYERAVIRHNCSVSRTRIINSWAVHQKDGKKL
jgi:hypothetical protein